MCPRSLDEGLVWTDADGRTFQRWEVYESVKAERDRLREAVNIALDVLRRSAEDHNCDYCRADMAAVERAWGHDQAM